MNIFDAVTSKEIATYYNTLASNKVPYLGRTLFPARKQLGLDLSWIKGSKGLPVVLKPSAFDVKATLRDRIGFSKLDMNMPFFKEAMMIKEKDRQELNKVLASGQQQYIDLILRKIFDDKTALIDGAIAQTERMIMQTLTTGKIEITAEGSLLDYDYHLASSQKVTAKTLWSDTANAVPIQDLQEWMDAVEDRSGTRPSRAICTRKTWSYLLQNKSIKMDMNVINGDKIILTDSMLDQYVMSKLGLKIQTYNKKFIDEAGVEQNYFPDNLFVLIPSGSLGYSYFGTTPEESDLLSGSEASVSIVETGVAITTMKQVDPVNVETKVTMVNLPSFEKADEILIATVGA